MFLTMIYILTLLGSFAGLLYYIVDSFQRKEGSGLELSTVGGAPEILRACHRSIE